MTRYVRVKDKTTKHEFDLPVESFDSDIYTRVERYSETTRPRRPKPNVPAGGKRTAPVKTEKE